MALTAYVPSNTWLTRPRSADPYLNNWLPASYPPNLRPVYGDVSRDYLAGLWQAVNARRVNEGLVVEDWVYSCPDADLEFGNALTRQDVLEAFENTIALVNHAERGQLETSVQHHILMDLEGAMQSDQAGLFPHRQQVTFETQHLFRAMSYVSYCCRSSLLGQVLHTFFTQHVRWIAQNNGRRALWQWCNAIMESAMNNNMKRDCISQLNILRPDLFEPANARAQEGSVRKLSHLVRDLINTIQGARYSISAKHQDRPCRRRSWEGRNQVSRYSPGEEARQREKLRDDLRYHEQQAERSRKKLSRLDSDDEYNYESRRPKSYGQRRAELEDSWDKSSLWSGPD